MAVVEVKFLSNLGSAVRYVAQGRDSSDVVSAKGCAPETAQADFEATAAVWKSKGTKKAYHIMQSWNEKESKLLPPEKFHEIGKKLVETYFPDHQYVISTHTGTGKTHNHILVNMVNEATGKKIENKKYHLYRLRDISDSLCKEYGLSVIDEKAKERQANLPDIVRRIDRFNGKSYIMDMMGKADFARRYSTGYDEYRAILGEFGIGVRVEEKNITYFYPGRDRGKRGAKLGKKYDKGGLEESFKKNDELFAARPELRLDYREGLADLRAGNSGHAVGKDYGAYTKSPRTKGAPPYPHELEFKASVIPQSEIRRARQSILEYCRRENIATMRNDKGERVLRGRSFVVLDDFEWTNRRNNTTGTLIEFVAAHKDVSFLQAISKINNNSRLLLLEHAFGEEERRYTSFYIPKAQTMDHPEASKRLGALLNAHRCRPDSAAALLAAQSQVERRGAVRLFPQGEPTGALEFTEDTPGKWSKKKVGAIKRPFFVGQVTGTTATVYTDPFSLIQKHGTDILLNPARAKNVLALLEPAAAPVDLFVAENKQIKRLLIRGNEDGRLAGVELDFFNNLKTRYRTFGIEVAEWTHAHEHTREGPELSL